MEIQPNPPCPSFEPNLELRQPAVMNIKRVSLSEVHQLFFFTAGNEYLAGGDAVQHELLPAAVQLTERIGHPYEARTGRTGIRSLPGGGFPGGPAAGAEGSWAAPPDR